MRCLLDTASRLWSIHLIVLRKYGSNQLLIEFDSIGRGGGGGVPGRDEGKDEGIVEGKEVLLLIFSQLFYCLMIVKFRNSFPALPQRGFLLQFQQVLILTWL